MIKDLASLLGDVGEAAFLDHFAQKRRLHVSAGPSDRAAGLLPWATINQLIETDTLSPDRFKLRRASGSIPAGMFRDGEGGHNLNAGRLEGLLRQGTSIVIDRIDDLAPPVGDLAVSLERRLGCMVWANAYLSFAKGGALPPHHDLHDVLVVQAHGRKRWRVYPTQEPAPIKPQAAATRHPDPIWEGWLEPGDVLYLPRGEPHDAEVSGGDSVHISFGLLPRRGLDLFRWLEGQAEASALLRADLPRPAEPMQEHEAALKRELHAMIDAASLEAFLAYDDARRKRRPLVALGPAAALEPETVAEATPRRALALSPQVDRTLEIVIGGEPFDLSRDERRVLAYLLARDAASVGAIMVALPDLADAKAALARLSRLTLVRLRAP
jgi:hypothetical protein